VNIASRDSPSCASRDARPQRRLAARAVGATNLSQPMANGGSLDDEQDREPLDPAEPAPPVPPSTARSLRDIAQGLWSPRAPREPAANRVPASREVVNGLDAREYKLGWAASLLAVAMAIAAYLSYEHSKIVKDRNDAVVVLISFLVGAACMMLGTGLRRRALLGFASFLVGLEVVSYKIGGVVGFVWLGFGFWLISRVLRKQRQDKDAKKPPAAKPAATRAATPPKASKRYTPPRARSASSRRR
jgi:hypothetical protein